MSLFDKKKILIDKLSLYHRVIISESGGVRSLRFGNDIVQSAVHNRDPFAMQVDYTRYLTLGLAFNPGGRELLAVGLGSGAVPKLISRHCPEINIKAVEIDPLVAELAQRYLRLEPRPGFDIIIMDGRAFLRTCNRKYDIIILDAYNAEGVPFHLTTLEFLRLVKSRLNERGVVTANLWSLDWELFVSMLRTYGEVFEHIHRFPVSGKKNVVIAACDFRLSADELRSNALLVQAKAAFPFDYVSLTSHLDRKEFKSASAPLLTDEKAPQDWLNRKGG